MKIVYNACFGGFSLSHAAILRYAEIKGITLYVELGEHRWHTQYWTLPENERSPLLKRDWSTLTLAERMECNRLYNLAILWDREIDRDDPALVQAVEELGPLANGDCAELKIAEVAAGERYRIDEYDGSERVVTIDGYDWKVAR